MARIIRNIIAVSLVVLTLVTSVGIKMYIHECLTCDVTDISLIDQVSSCHEHHEVYHVNHIEQTCCENDCDKGFEGGCCSSHEAFILYHFDYAPERNLVYNLQTQLIAEIQLHPDIISENLCEIATPFQRNFSNPPPLLKAGMDLIKSIHQFRFNCCFLS